MAYAGCGPSLPRRGSAHASRRQAHAFQRDRGIRLHVNITAIEKADKKLGGGNLIEQFPDVTSKVVTLINDAKVVIGLNLVFRLVIKSCNADDSMVDTMEKRAAAVTEVQAALKKFDIQMPDETISLLSSFVTG